MTATVDSTHMPALGEHQRGEIGRELQATLIDLLNLALDGKHLHWSVVGPHFRSLHELLDELVAAWHDLADTVAERAVAIGSFPDGQAAAVAAGSTLAPIARGPVEDVAVVRHLARRLAEASERSRARMDRLGAIDVASQDVLVEVVRTLEKHLWLVRSHLPLSAN